MMEYLPKEEHQEAVWKYHLSERLLVGWQVKKKAKTLIREYRP
jgi:hypothetical protein